MTAIGFVLLIIGSIWCYIAEDSEWLPAASCTFLIGVLLLVTGIAKWLWRVMP